MPIEIELPRWSASVACKIAGLGLDGPLVIRKWRRDAGLRLGKFVADEGWLFTVLDIGELTITCALQEAGVPVSEAITRARAERNNLCATLRARLECGYWLPPRLMHVNMSEPTATSRFLSLGEIAERVIDKLHLPLPIISQMPREKEQAELIVEAASRYLVSDEFQIRADKFRDEVIARGKLTNWCEASTRLGVPLWLIIDATHSQAIDGCDKSALGSIMSVVRERLAIRPAITSPMETIDVVPIGGLLLADKKSARSVQCDQGDEGDDVLVAFREWLVHKARVDSVALHPNAYGSSDELKDTCKETIGSAP